MQRKIHMQDQVYNNVESIIHHYDKFAFEIWGMKVVLFTAFLMLGVYW